MTRIKIITTNFDRTFTHFKAKDRKYKKCQIFVDQKCKIYEILTIIFTNENSILCILNCFLDIYDRSISFIFLAKMSDCIS